MCSTIHLQQVYFAETLGENGTVVLLESGPFKLEASCYTTLKYYHVSNHHDDDFNIDDDSPPSRGSSYSFFFDDEDDGSSYSETRSYTLSYVSYTMERLRRTEANTPFFMIGFRPPHKKRFVCEMNSASLSPFIA